MNGKIIGRKPLYVAVAQRKEERKARLLVTFHIYTVSFNFARGIYYEEFCVYFFPFPFWFSNVPLFLHGLSYLP